MNQYFIAAPSAHQKKEKEKARELKASQWWRNQMGKGECYHCHGKFSPKEMTMDHLIPIVRGGKSDRKNCVTSCKECNSKKGNRTIAEMVMDEAD